MGITPRVEDIWIMRDWHYWKKAGPASAPSNIIVVDAEAWHGHRTLVAEGIYGPHPGERQTFRLAVALCYRLERGVRTRVQLHHHVDSPGFWRVAESRIDESRPLWIFCHNAGYDIPILGGWSRILGSDFKAESVILTQATFLIKGLWHGKPVIFSDLTNYFHCKLSAVGEAVGMPKLEMPHQDAPDSAWFRYCENDVLITAAGLDALIEYQRKNELGPWAVSIAGLAFNAFRSRFMHHKILVAADSNVCQIERDAYFGGICDSNYIGKVPTSPVYELDVNSMYGWACKQKLPYRLVPTKYTASVRALADCDPGDQVIAEVTIDSDTLRFPVRTRQGTIYPVGRYRTTLPYPELKIALAAGAVKSVHHSCWYRAGHIFADYMAFFGREKIKYEGCHCDEGPQDGGTDTCGRCGCYLKANKAFRTLSKYYTTNLYGKCGQRRPKWEEWGEESLQRYERERGLKEGTLAWCYEKPPQRERFENTKHIMLDGGIVDVRNWFGFTEIGGEREESRDSFPAIAATVTSYARCKLRSYHAIAGMEEWFQSDTDSVWTSKVGFDRLSLAGAISGEGIGGLELEDVHEWLTIHGPKDYETDKTTKLKGIKPFSKDQIAPDAGYLQSGDIAVPILGGGEEAYFILTKEGEFRVTKFTRPLAQLKKQQLDGVFVAHETKKLSREITKCKVLPTGWTRPLRFPQENPDRHCASSQ